MSIPCSNLTNDLPFLSSFELLSRGKINQCSRPCSNETCCIFTESNPPDLYQEDESDVGPRILPTLVRINHSASLESGGVIFLEAVTVFNNAIFHHVKSHLFEAQRLYQSLVGTIHSLLQGGIGSPSTAVLEMAMRVYNNLALTFYADGDDVTAHSHFQAALLFSKQLFQLNKASRLEYATILSNLCRLNWMKGDISDNLYTSLREILRLRSSLLSWDHPDVAAAHYNLAMAEYAREGNQKAVAHLKQYLYVATHCNNKNGGHTVLDPIPALIYLLLLQNEDNEDSTSQELVRGLYTLQDKRHDQGQNSSEVASVLNFIGTLLFHKEDLETALFFFEEELRLEEQLLQGEDDISVSVTCNNIGRILQELEKFDEAIGYYERALKAQYHESTIMHFKACATIDLESDSGASNLYSTVWYNLGLIHDKRCNYAEAIVAFKMSLGLRLTMLGRDHPDITCLYYNIGVLQMEMKQLDDASESLKEALRVHCRDSAATNQLNDQRVIKTLEKLSTMHKNRGNMEAAIDALREVLRILQTSKDCDANSRTNDIGLVLHSISELYHAMGNLPAALSAAMESARHLEFIFTTYKNDILVPTADKLTNIEQIVSSLFLLGSLYHEMCEPLHADGIFHKAGSILEATITNRFHQPIPSSLYAICEVAKILATAHCAAEA
jgi:tetratricopeptide (TPR) repeat protein